MKKRIRPICVFLSLLFVIPVRSEELPHTDPGPDLLAEALSVIRASCPWDPDKTVSGRGCPPEGALLTRLVAWEYLRADSVEAALSVAREFGNTGFLIDVLGQSASHCFRRGRVAGGRQYLEEATGIAESISTEPGRSLAWMRIFQARLELEGYDTASELLPLADSLRTLNPAEWSNNIEIVVRRLAATGRVDEALGLIEQLHDPHGYSRSDQLSRLAIALAGSDEVAEAVRLAAAIPDTSVFWISRMRAYRAIARGWCVQDQWATALSTGEALRGYPIAQAEILLAVAGRADSSNRSALADSLGLETLALIRFAPRPVPSGNEWDAVRLRLAGHFSRRNDTDRALIVARSIPIDIEYSHNARAYRSRALVWIGTAMLKVGDVENGTRALREAREVMRGTPEESGYAIFLSATSKELEQTGFHDLALEYREMAVAEARKLPPRDRAYAFYWIVSEVSPALVEERTELILEGFEACQGIADPAARARMLLYLGGLQLQLKNPRDPCAPESASRDVRPRESVTMSESIGAPQANRTPNPLIERGT